jgi:hypothetical protein
MPPDPCARAASGGTRDPGRPDSGGRSSATSAVALTDAQINAPQQPTSPKRSRHNQIVPCETRCRAQPQRSHASQQARSALAHVAGSVATDLGIAVTTCPPEAGNNAVTVRGHVRDRLSAVGTGAATQSALLIGTICLQTTAFGGCHVMSTSIRQSPARQNIRQPARASRRNLPKTAKQLAH